MCIQPEMETFLEGLRVLRRASRLGKLDKVRFEIPREDIINSVQGLASFAGVDGDLFLLFADTKAIMYEVLLNVTS